MSVKVPVLVDELAHCQATFEAASPPPMLAVNAVPTLGLAESKLTDSDSSTSVTVTLRVMVSSIVLSAVSYTHLTLPTKRIV